MPPPPDDEHAASPVIGALLIIGIVIILAMMVLLLCSGFRLPSDYQVPVIFRISSVTFVPDSSGTGVRGIVTLTNTRSESYRNRYLSVITYVNGAQAPCNIPTLNNGLFCTLNHYGVWHIYGVGTHGNADSPTSVWPGHSDISIEYKKGILRQGDTVSIEIVDTEKNRIISRDTFPHTTARDARWFYHYFLNPQAA